MRRAHSPIRPTTSQTRTKHSTRAKVHPNNLICTCSVCWSKNISSRCRKNAERHVQWPSSSVCSSCAGFPSSSYMSSSHSVRHAPPTLVAVSSHSSYGSATSTPVSTLSSILSSILTSGSRLNSCFNVNVNDDEQSYIIYLLLTNDCVHEHAWQSETGFVMT